jgi:hypothetical protein
MAKRRNRHTDAVELQALNGLSFPLTLHRASFRTKKPDGSQLQIASQHHITGWPDTFGIAGRMTPEYAGRLMRLATKSLLPLDR